MSDFKDFTRYRKVDICVTGHIELDTLNEIYPEREPSKEGSPTSGFDWVSYEQKEEEKLISYLKTIDSRDPWAEVLVACRDKRVVEGIITDITKGGYDVSVMGMKAFLPDSQIDVLPVANFKELIGKTVNCLILRVNPKYKAIVVGRKEYVKKYIHDKWKATSFSSIRKGDVIKARVYDIKSNKIIFDIGGFLCSFGNKHFNIRNDGKIKCLKSNFKLNNYHSLIVTEIDYEKSKISLSLGLAIKEVSQYENDSYKNKLVSKYKQGSIVRGRVSHISSKGIFVDIGDVYGLLLYENIRLDHTLVLQINKTYNFIIENNLCTSDEDYYVDSTFEDIILGCDYYLNYEHEWDVYSKTKEEFYNQRLNKHARKTRTLSIDYESEIMSALENGYGDIYGFD